MLLELAYAVPLASVLGSLYGGAPVDLALIFGEAAAKLPPAPPAIDVARWVAWLGACSTEQLGVVLDVLAPLASQKVEAARASLSRDRVRRSDSFGGMDLVVVDRKVLAKLLGEMTTGPRRILRVEGERGAGKSFTARILQAYLGSSRGADQLLVQADFATGGLPALVSWILRCIRGDAVPLPAPDDTTHVRWIEQLAELVATEAVRERADARTVWLALDRCSLAAETGEGRGDPGVFVRRLTELCEERAKHPHALRLVLIECPRELTLRRQRALLEERIAPVLRSDIEEFFRMRKIADEGIAAAVDGVLAAMNASGPAYPLECMQESIAGVLAGGAGGARG